MSATIRASIELPAGSVVVQAAAPELVSQKTSEMVLGIGKRAYLDSLPEYRCAGGEVISLGRLRLVNRESYVTWLSERMTESKDDGTAELAAELGFRMVG